MFSAYQLVAASMVGAAYCFIRLFNRSSTSRWSYLAVFSAIGVVVNPGLTPVFLGGLPYMSLEAFIVGVLAFGTGTIAAYLIQRSRGSLRGLPFAIFGIVGGGLWVLYGVGSFVIVVLFLLVMSGWK